MPRGDQLVFSSSFGSEEQFEPRGIFLYPDHGYREWHTNRRHKKGWRMYLIKVPEPGLSHFAFRDPLTGAVHREPDSPGCVNMFYVDDETPLYHTIYSLTSRWSYGLWLSDAAAESVLRCVELSRGLYRPVPPHHVEQ
eukprot:gene11319-2061_t